MNKEFNQFYNTQDLPMQGNQDDNMYELAGFYSEECKQSLPPPPQDTKQRQSSWSKPLLFITVLLCLILILLIIILGIVTVVYATGNNVECTNTATGASSSSNTNEWADRIAQNISQKIPDFNEWANGVVSKVNSNVTGSFPDFNEWANGVSQNTLQLFQNNTNFTELDAQILQTTRDSAQKLINIVNTLSNLQDTSTSTAGVADDILLIAQELLVLHNDSTALPTSCKEIKERQPLSPSGYYILVALNGGTYETYCNMGILCGSGGGWTRLAYLDMSDATQNCPSGFRLYQSGGVRACGRPVTNSGSCVSVQFPSNGISYSEVCGRVFGHSYNSPDAVNTEHGSNNNNINGDYVDGVSITHGYPRQHVWTLMATGADSLQDGGRYNCPCISGNNVNNRQVPPAFVGSDYFCEGAGGNWNDLLWDGNGCSSDETLCCSAPGLPWFHRDYSSNTTDYIELRVCGDESTSNEDVPVSFYEIYIK